MKYIYLLLLTTAALFPNPLPAQELSDAANRVKINAPDQYDCIKEKAIEEWGDDHKMVLYRINQQCDALYDFSLALKKYEKEDQEYKILMRATAKWTEGDPSTLCSTDWRMVMYEFNNQLESYNKY